MILYLLCYNLQAEILLGDFNIDLFKSNINQEISYFLDILGQYIHLFDCVPSILFHSISDHLLQYLLISSTDKHSDRGGIPTSYQNWSKFDQGNFNT